uniref:Uncharacterized protein n=1 Tax=Anguilla anguilla TaxID=7936 RepID=A0A0E9U2H7_ANGAN
MQLLNTALIVLLEFHVYVGFFQQFFFSV